MKLRLEALSPVHIWNGEKKSPYVDYILERGKIKYLDMDKLIRNISHNERLIDEYVRIVRSRDANAREKYTIRDFFQDNQIDVNAYIQVVLEFFGTNRYNEINEISKTAGRAYIPGSSIKGAIRTCLLYDHYARYGYDSEEIKRWLGFKNKKTHYIGQNIMRKNEKKVQEDMLRFLQVTDTGWTSFDNIAVYEERLLDYVAIKNGKEGSKLLPTFNEGIKPQTILDFEIRTKGKPVDKLPQSFEYLLEGREEQIFSKINQFYKQNLLYYVDIMEQTDKGLFSYVISKYLKYVKWIEALEKDSTGFIMRLGSHKSMYDNTVDMLFKDNPGLMHQIRVATFHKKGQIPKYNPYPKTDWFILDESGINAREAVGWIKVTKRSS